MHKMQKYPIRDGRIEELSKALPGFESIWQKMVLLSSKKREIEQSKRAELCNEKSPRPQSL